MLAEVAKHLERDKPLPARYGDHPLIGRWSGYRDCHLEFDLVLIYQKRGPDELALVRLGTHSELFG
jgi:mRNA interferase YafQ